MDTESKIKLFDEMEALCQSYSMSDGAGNEIDPDVCRVAYMVDRITGLKTELMEINECIASAAGWDMRGEQFTDWIKRAGKVMKDLPTVPKVVMEECGECKGKGRVYPTPKDVFICGQCHGRGKVAVKCDACPAGPLHGVPCAICHGHGLQTERVVKLEGDSVWLWQDRNRGHGDKPHMKLYERTINCAGKDFFNIKPYADIVKPEDCYADEATAKLIGAKG